ncbi:MAG: hypothetical protein E7455_06465 [Ruminococcaceae bacterium]|nr:hypothetical protein [Oscillospiraceae bacterium]
MKTLIVWTLLAVLLMIGGPWLALQFAGMDAMGICFILFFAINPLFSVVCGALAGKKIRQLWALPIITAGLFLLGVWLFFEMGEPAFLIYSGSYLIISIIAMLISAFVNRKQR